MEGLNDNFGKTCEKARLRTLKTKSSTRRKNKLLSPNSLRKRRRVAKNGRQFPAHLLL